MVGSSIVSLEDDHQHRAARGSPKRSLLISDLKSGFELDHDPLPRSLLEPNVPAPERSPPSAWSGDANQRAARNASGRDDRTRRLRRDRRLRGGVLLDAATSGPAAGARRA